MIGVSKRIKYLHSTVLTYFPVEHLHRWDTGENKHFWLLTAQKRPRCKLCLRKHSAWQSQENIWTIQINMTLFGLDVKAGSLTVAPNRHCPDKLKNSLVQQDDKDLCQCDSSVEKNKKTPILLWSCTWPLTSIVRERHRKCAVKAVSHLKGLIGIKWMKHIKSYTSFQIWAISIYWLQWGFSVVSSGVYMPDACFPPTRQRSR